MDKNTVQEDISALYLRLNGYFLAPRFVIHLPGPQGQKAELDLLGVRFPHNSEPERAIGPSAYFQVSNEAIDFVVCEVKGGENNLSFNASLRRTENVDALATLIRWMGAFEEEEITGLAPRLQQLIHFDHRTASDHFPTLPCPRRMQIRAILFAPDRAERTRRVVRYIHGQELTGYIWNCFRPNQPRPTCATKYRINTWGHYSPIVRCFKDPTRDQPPTMDEIYQACGCQD